MKGKASWLPTFMELSFDLENTGCLRQEVPIGELVKGSTPKILVQGSGMELAPDFYLGTYCQPLLIPQPSQDWTQQIRYFILVCSRRS